MRKRFNGLSGLVRNELGKEPAGGDVFVFLNRNRTHLKLLHWERGGFVLYYKRLEQGAFTLPSFKRRNKSNYVVATNADELIKRKTMIRQEQKRHLYSTTLCRGNSGTRK